VNGEQGAALHGYTPVSMSLQDGWIPSHPRKEDEERREFIVTSPVALIVLPERLLG